MAEQPSPGAKSGGMTVGLAEVPGQTIHEIEVPDEMMDLEGQDLMEKLGELDAVKTSRANLVTAGPVDPMPTQTSLDGSTGRDFSTNGAGISAGQSGSLF